MSLEVYPPHYAFQEVRHQRLEDEGSMVSIHEAIFTDVFFASWVSYFSVQLSHLFIRGLNEISFMIGSEIWGFWVKVNPEPRVAVEVGASIVLRSSHRNSPENA